MNHFLLLNIHLVFGHFLLAGVDDQLARLVNRNSQLLLTAFLACLPVVGNELISLAAEYFPSLAVAAHNVAAGRIPYVELLASALDVPGAAVDHLEQFVTLLRGRLLVVSSFDPIDGLWHRVLPRAATLNLVSEHFRALGLR